MRVRFVFVSKDKIRIPVHYNEVIQGIIYRYLDHSLSDFLHDKGYSCEKRRFKLFTFSRIFGRSKRVGSFFEFSSPISIIVASPKDQILQSLAENMVRAGEITLYSRPVYIESIEVEVSHDVDQEVMIRMLSPMTMYSTLKTPEGRSKTYYYNPREAEFSRLIRDNMMKKYHVTYRHPIASNEFSITPDRVSKWDEKVITYKGFIIKAWMGMYRIRGNPELIKLAYDAGIGGKNAQGFGCFEMIKRSS